MPRLKRRALATRSIIGHGHLSQLACGHDYFSTGWGRLGSIVLRPHLHADEQPDADLLDEIQAAWERYRDELTLERKRLPGTRCSAWWRFDAPEPRDPAREQPEQLDDLKLLTSAELESLSRWARGVGNDLYEPPFRRSWAWWRFLSPERRDKSRDQGVQLVDMHLAGEKVLTDREQHIVSERRDLDIIGSIYKLQRDLELMDYLDLTAAERAHLGLPLVEHDDE